MRAPASSAATLTIHSTSLAASVGDSNACEIWGHASRKNRSLWNTAAIVAGSVRPVHSVGGPRRGATRPPSACDIFRLMATLVTGAFGCIGSWVVRDLLVAGERPVVFDLGDDPWRMRMIAGADVASRVTIVRGDVADRDALVRVVRDHGIRRIVHLAAWQIPLCRQDPSRGALINVVGTANVFEAARAPLAAGASRLDGARAYNRHGASTAIAGLVRMLEGAWPNATGLITHVEQPIPFPAALDDARYQKDLGPAPPTSLADGIKKTLDGFARLRAEGRLDARELA